MKREKKKKLYGKNKTKAKKTYINKGGKYSPNAYETSVQSPRRRDEQPLQVQTRLDVVIYRQQSRS